MFRIGSWAITPAVLTIAVATTSACATALSLHGLNNRERRPIAKAKGREAKDDKVYPPDRYPGARDILTPYGTIKVYEWGPADGEKVLLIQGIGTPSLGYAGIANELVANGYRVMTFDYFGRGHSDSPTDLAHDLRLYLSQLLLVLASSHLPWTGDAAFHLIGYSLGGGLAASTASYYPHLLRSLTVVCPGGLVRSKTQLSWTDRMLYSDGLFPDWLLRWTMRRRLDPGKGGKDVPVEFERRGEDAELGGYDEVAA